MVTPIALVTLLSINANGQETNARDNLTAAQQFVRAVFPDLKGPLSS
jgi:hypothetical protein